MIPIWIIGGGKFGLKAANVLGRKFAEAELTVVEKNRQTCRQLATQVFKTVCMDGIRYLEQNLRDADYPDWIIPAIPLHVAYEWIQAKLSQDYDLQTLAVPGQLRKLLPNPASGGIGQLYLSNADFFCPENCSEPDDFCVYTGEPRPRILHEFLTDIRYKDFQPVVVCSQQLAPGIGGYRPQALFDALRKIISLRGPVLLSTACRCHGVMHAFAVSEKIKCAD